MAVDSERVAKLRKKTINGQSVKRLVEAGLTTATAKVKDKVLFLVEGKQGGICEMRNIPAEQMGPILGVVCPSIIYPYLRSNVADLITRTGLPPVDLAEVNFEAFYNQKMAALAQQAAGVNGNGAAANA